MQPQFYMYCFPWDLEDEGLEESIGRLAGEIGVDGINVAATTSEILQYRPRKPLDKRVFKTEAGAHFQPDKKFYSSCRIKPHPAAWIKSRNALDRIVKVCEKEKLKVRASINCCVGRSMVERYPFAACVNALGVQSDRVLCPSHPDVREFIAAMVDDLSSNYDLTSLDICQLRWEMSTDFNELEMLQPRWSCAVDELLGRCFCPACRQAFASLQLPFEEARLAAIALIEDRLDCDSAVDSDQRDTFVEDLNWHETGIRKNETLIELLTQLRNRSKCSVAARFNAAVFPKDADYIREHLNDCADALLISGRLLNDGEEESAIEDYKSLDPQRIDVVKSVELSPKSNEQSLVASVHSLAKCGYRSIGLSNYGLMSQSALDAIRQAIRFARRETR